MVAEQTGTRTRIKMAAPRRKRRDTHVGTIEELTGLDFGVRSDMHLGTLLERRNAAWLIEILNETPEQDGVEAEQQDAAPGEPDEAESAESLEEESLVSVELVVLDEIAVAA